MAALEKYFEIEDKLTAAIQSLNPSEQDIIIRCYMDGKPNWLVASDVVMMLDIDTQKNTAIRNIASKI